MTRLIQKNSNDVDDNRNSNTFVVSSGNEAIIPAVSQTGIGRITKKEEITVACYAYHNEISILENQWDIIKHSINRIKESSSYDLKSAMFGAFITCLTQAISENVSGVATNWIPSIICLVLLLFVCGISEIYPNKFMNYYNNSDIVETVKFVINQVDGSRQSIHNRK